MEDKGVTLTLDMIRDALRRIDAWDAERESQRLEDLKRPHGESLWLDDKRELVWSRRTCGWLTRRNFDAEEQFFGS
jgi:hypothetical protein